MSNKSAAPVVPIGVYRGPACGIGAIEAYEAWLGRPVRYVLEFLLDRPPSWAEFERGVFPTGTNGRQPGADVSAWQGALGERGLMLALPACCLGSTWADEAAGKNDQHWTALGNHLVELGFGDAVLRIGRELNGSWYPWRVEEGHQSEYTEGYRHVVTVLRSVPGARFTFMWNPYIGTGTLSRSGVETSYPGDQAVDVIGLDIYDGDWSGIYHQSLLRGDTRTQRQQRAVWGNFVHEWDGLTGWLNLARDHRKPLAYPEWGLRLWLDGEVDHGGGDNPLFVNQMASWLTDTHAWMQAMWEDHGMGVFDPDDAPRRRVAVPRSRVAFLDCFRQ